MRPRAWYSLSDIEFEVLSRETCAPNAFYTEVLTERITIVHKFDIENAKITEWDWNYENNDVKKVVLFDGTQKSAREIYQAWHKFMVEKINQLNSDRIEKYEKLLNKMEASEYFEFSEQFLE